MLNENQLFYAALWWTSGLPGGPDHVPALLVRYGKDPIVFPPCDIKRGRKEIDPYAMSGEEIAQLQADIKRGHNPADEILSPETLNIFFDHLFAALQSRDELEYTATGKDRYLDMRQRFNTSLNPNIHGGFTNEIEVAIAAAKINPHAVPQKAHLYAHDDGQLIVQTNDQNGQLEMVALPYPGQPPIPYRPINLKSADMDHCPTLIWETLYRIVPLKAGEKYTRGYITVTGERVTTEDEVFGDNKVLTVGNSDVEKTNLLWTLTDDEIRTGHTSIRGSFAGRAAEYTPGYKCPHSENYVEGTDLPNIVRHLTPGVAFMIATEPVQIGCGSSFSIAQAGDFIISEGKGYGPRVIEKSLVTKGTVRFILPPPAAKSPNLSLN